MPYTLYCAIIGRNDNDIFPIHINETQTVGELKHEIKKKAETTGSAHNLKLYKVDINISDDDDDDDDETFNVSTNYKQVMEKISQNTTYTQEIQDLSTKPKQVLTNPLRKLSAIFRKSPPCVDETIHILVELPPESSRSVPEPKTTPKIGAENDVVTVDTVKTRIEAFVKELRPEIRRFLTNPRLPSWLPPESVDDETRRFYRDLEIPLVKGKPCLLLHNLGDTCNPNVDKLFRGQKHRILCNTSGSGKTRLLLEGLSHRWGFYFAIERGSDGIGARDLEAVIGMMKRTSGWTHNIFTNLGSKGIQSVNTEHQERNAAIATNSISKAILARWVVFQTFIEVAKELVQEGKFHGKIQRDWLLFQILPLVPIDGVDPFSAFIKETLSSVVTGVLDALLCQFSPNRVLGPSFDFDSNRDSFFYVIDEAQVAGKTYMGAFGDTVPRPVLRPIIQEMTSAEGIASVKIIVSGTGFSLALFKTAMASGIGKDATHFDVVHTTGDFSDRDTQSHYISCYLPPSFLSSESGTYLRTRVYDWLRGRHRFTVRFLEELMTRPWHENRPATPHKLLDAYVQEITGYPPSDSAARGEEGHVGPVLIQTFQWDRITTHPYLLDDLAHKIYTWLLRGITPTWSAGQELLVEYGIARFVHAGQEETDTTTIEEPLALMGITQYFASSGYSLESHVRKLSRDNQGTALEEAVILGMTRLLQNKRSLGSFLTFYKKSPWGALTAQIVAPNSSGGYDDFRVDGLFSNPAFKAKRPEDVKNWLERRKEVYCIPGNRMGPDLITRVRLSDGEVVLLFIQAKCHLSGNNETSVSAGAIRSLVPGRFFSSLDKQQEGIKSMLDTIRRYKILRVIAGFPLDINFKSASKVIKSALAEDKHPLAKLDHGPLIETLATCDNGSWFVTNLTSSLKRSRSEGPDDEAEDDRPDAKRRRPV